MLPCPNGFVHTLISAYNQHHALILRPDDVWLAILVQFNFFVNANAELLRASFVAHEGKQALAVYTTSFHDFGLLSRDMADLIHKNVADPTLRDWALPDFTTTTVTDKTVGAIVLMATLKSYFEYVYCEVCCGIPRVTLAGEKSDWQKILQRVEKLKEYGVEMIAWYHLLVPVLERFVWAFDDPTHTRNISFWQNVAHYQPGGSGPSYYSGWISAFCAFNDKGKWMGQRLKQGGDAQEAPDSLSAKAFWAKYGAVGGGGQYILDDTRYHQIDAANIPPCYAQVDVRLMSQNSGENRMCSMTAGVVGSWVSSSKDITLSEAGKNDTVRPAVGWWLFNRMENHEIGQ
ncbi:hypothetical protein C8F01DRAFT_281687 [Mycena amicta]|nr:hypothetical protein C8F01DRAFT_281687 [Mycena amicta]